MHLLSHFKAFSLEREIENSIMMIDNAITVLLICSIMCYSLFPSSFSQAGHNDKSN